MLKERASKGIYITTPYQLNQPSLATKADFKNNSQILDYR